MYKPVQGEWQKLVRLERRLKGLPRGSLEYRRQGRCEASVGYSDSDWASDKKTGKSSSGGLAVVGSHMIKSWSRSHDSLMLSSAEAELVALGKLAMELLGLAARPMSGA